MKQPRKKAVALKYDPHQDHAPRLSAKGTGTTAERIIELASMNGIPVKEDPDLILSLMALDWHEEIPPELYEGIAEILAFVYRVNRKYGGE